MSDAVQPDRPGRDDGADWSGWSGRDDGAEDLLGPCEDWPIEAGFRVRASLDVAEALSGVRHVGVGILLHHLGMARVGDTVDVRVEVVGVDGRTVHLVRDARGNGDLVGSGSHQRVLLPADAA